MKQLAFCSLAALLAFGISSQAAEPAPTVTKNTSRAALLDRIYGGWAGMLIGGLEGLPHEFKYREQPRDSLPDFTFLPNGARSDDDNDFEWPHLWFMDKEGVIKQPYPRIVETWKANMNQGIWVANKQARKLMDEGVVPPETGSVARNPHACYTDWKAARQALHEKWRKQRKWNDNSTPVNGLAVVLALLYGQDDFYRTLQYAMALGYDADCNAATAGAVVGCRLGFRHIAALPQFKMPDRYVNKTRPSLPAECKVSEQAETLLRVCERVILANGGQRISIGGEPGFRVKLQPPRVLERLPDRPHGPDNPPPKSAGSNE